MKIILIILLSFNLSCQKKVVQEEDSKSLATDESLLLINKVETIDVKSAKKSYSINEKNCARAMKVEDENIVYAKKINKSKEMLLCQDSISVKLFKGSKIISNNYSTEIINFNSNSTKLTLKYTGNQETSDYLPNSSFDFPIDIFSKFNSKNPLITFQYCPSINTFSQVCPDVKTIEALSLVHPGKIIKYSFISKIKGGALILAIIQSSDLKLRSLPGGYQISAFYINNSKVLASKKLDSFGEIFNRGALKLKDGNLIVVSTGIADAEGGYRVRIMSFNDEKNDFKDHFDNLEYVEINDVNNSGNAIVLKSLFDRNEDSSLTRWQRPLNKSAKCPTKHKFSLSNIQIGFKKVKESLIVDNCSIVNM